MQFNEEKIDFSTNGDRMIVKKKKKIKTKWIRGLNVKSKRIKLEEYIGENICYFVLGNIAYILHRTRMIYKNKH